MDWPADLIATFKRGLKVKPSGDLSRDQVMRLIFDETARRAVWRARGDPARLGAALRTPYTPLGSVVPCGLLDWVQTASLEGRAWGDAVDALHQYLEANAAAVCEAFQDEQQPYDSDIGFGF
jgi:hypothetical protein